MSGNVSTTFKKLDCYFLMKEKSLRNKSSANFAFDLPERIHPTPIGNCVVRKARNLV